MVIKMKKVISVILTVLIFSLTLLAIPTFAKNPVELRLNDTTVYAGDEFELKLYISDNSQLSGAVIDIKYDADMLEFISAENGAILDKSANVSVKDFKGDKSYIRFTYMSPSSSITSEGVLVTLTFKVLDNAVGETGVDISIPYAGDFVNSNLEKLSYVCENSTLKIINTTFVETETSEITSETSNESSSVTDISTETTTELPIEDDHNEKEDNLKIVIGLFVAGCVIIIAVIVYVVVDKKRKRGNE